LEILGAAFEAQQNRVAFTMRGNTLQAAGNIQVGEQSYKTFPMLRFAELVTNANLVRNTSSLSVPQVSEL